MSEDTSSNSNSSSAGGGGDDTCTVLTVVGPVRTVRRADVLRECGRYAALVRPESPEQQALLYGQGDLCVFAEAAAPEDAVAVSREQLRQKDDAIALLRELNRRLADEVRQLRAQLAQAHATPAATASDP